VGSWKTTFAAALAVGGLLATAALAATPGPPQVKDRITPLPCPKNPTTTLQLKACAGKRILRQDMDINKRVRKIWALLKTAAPRRRFAAGERAWLAYRRITCKSRSDVFLGGSLASLAYANCLGDLNRIHGRDLEVFQKALAKR
jgi:uncharacterized protein YecT (DUF1311 family)